jgi:uncharacterized protein YraI
MNYKMKDRIPLYKLLSIFLLAVMVLTACATPTPAPTQDPGPIQTQAALDTINGLTAAAPTPGPTQVPAPGPTASIPVVNAAILTPAAGQPAAIANYNTYVFGGPGENYVVYTAFLGGQQAIVVGKNADASWWAISMPSTPTGSGWVSAGWVTTIGAENVPVLPTPPVPPTTELVPPGPEDPVAVVSYNSYIRTGPGENYPAYGIAQPGATGRVIGKSMDGQWWAIRLDPNIIGNGMGWAAAATVQVTKAENVPSIETPPASAVAPLPPPASGAPQATAVDYVNVRSGPGEQYPILAVAAPGKSGEVAGVSEDQQWWQVKVPAQYSADGFGWVSASYVTTQNTASVPVAPAPPAPVYPETPPTTNQCSLLSQSPEDNSEFTPDTPFTVTWTLKNTGSEAWTTDSYDVRFLGANVQPFHQGADGYDFTSNVEPGWNYAVSVPMIAPPALGPYGEAWAIFKGSENICTFWVYINVK